VPEAPEATPTLVGITASSVTNWGDVKGSTALDETKTEPFDRLIGD
jgi:hypothetical protein